MKTKNASQYIALPVFDTTAGQQIGYVLDVCYQKDLKKVSGFLVVDDESEREYFLSKHLVKVAGDNCIMIEQSLQANFDADTNSFNPVGKCVYSHQGQLLGRVQQVLLDGWQVAKLQLDTCEIPASKIYCNGNNFVVFGKKPQKNIKNNSKNQKNINALPIVSIQNIPPNSAKIGITQTTKISSPSKVVLNPTTVMQKTATQDVYGLNNELIVKKGQIINQKILDKAKKHGKINLLIISCK